LSRRVWACVAPTFASVCSWPWSATQTRHHRKSQQSCTLKLPKKLGFTWCSSRLLIRVLSFVSGLVLGLIFTRLLVWDAALCDILAVLLIWRHTCLWGFLRLVYLGVLNISADFFLNFSALSRHTSKHLPLMLFVIIPEAAPGQRVTNQPRLSTNSSWLSRQV